MMQRHHLKPWIVPPGTVLPPPRPGVRIVRVPWLGLVISDDDLRQRVDDVFHWPMIVLALLVLPLLGIEFLERPERWTWLWWVSLIGMTVIWVAFVAEFVIKIAIAESRLEYARRNWLDILIILIPALRPLRVSSLARTTRVFTLRGVGMKCARYVFSIVIGMEATDRLLQRIGLRARHRGVNPARMTRTQLIDEVRRLRSLAERWEQWHEAEAQHLRERGIAPYDAPMPRPDPVEAPPSTAEDLPEPSG